MKEKSIILSAAGLKNIVVNEKDDEFVFIIGDSEMKMNRIFAEFLSPTVSQFHHSDPTINCLNITQGIISKSKNKNKSKMNLIENIVKTISDENMISKMIDISRGERIEYSSKEELLSLFYFSIFLNNDELTENIYEQLSEYENYQEKTIKEKVELLEIYAHLKERTNNIEGSKILEDILKGIEINSKNLEILKKVSKEVFYLILNNIEKSEIDSGTLLDLINEIFDSPEEEEETEHNIYEFYEKIELGELSFNKFSLFLNKMNYTEMTNGIWTQIVELLLNFKKEKDQMKEKTSEKDQKEEKEEEVGHLYEYDGNPSHRFEGIIQHLRGPEKQNPNDTGIINVTSSPIRNNCYPKYAVDFDSDQFFFAGGSKGWLKYDFKDKKIRPTRYSIKTSKNNDYYNPVNWCIEVSNTDEDSDWRIIDSRSGVTSVSKANQSDTFDIQTQLTTEENYRYIRFRSTGNTSGGCSWLIISSLEYFGALIE